MIKIKEEKPETCEHCNQKINKKEKTFDWHDFQISDSYLEIAYSFMEIQNNNRDKNPKTVKKEDLKKHTETFLYHAFLSEMENVLEKTDANSKENLPYKLGAIALEAVSNQITT
ncbi:MAG: hypothetical protein IPL26_16590 [Leptospiraceae bacterium]|nr:hypothetical protein [Leptospiraceae bacterium]